jgi:transposase InsO family protein
MKRMLQRPNLSRKCWVNTSIRYSERLAEAGIEPSVGSRGDSYDNALAETINGLHKAELIHRRAPWKTMAAVELATLEWVATKQLPRKAGRFSFAALGPNI